MSDAENKRMDAANYFAMCLLMPEDMVRAEVKKSPLIDIVDDDGDLKNLARKFGVSRTLMAVRLGQLGFLGKHLLPSFGSIPEFK